MLFTSFRSRSAQFERIKTPLLSAANWGGNSLHLRGNVAGFVRSASTVKWLEVHGNTHWVEFYTGSIIAGGGAAAGPPATELRRATGRGGKT